MKDIKILSLDLSSPRNFISTKKIKKQRDEVKFSFVSSWINNEQEPFDVIFFQGKQSLEGAKRIENGWHGNKYSSFFVGETNTAILIDNVLPVVGHSSFSNVGNSVVVSMGDNQYLNFLSIYLTNASSLKKFGEYYNHLIPSDKKGKTSMIVGGVFPSLSSIKNLISRDNQLVDSCFAIDQVSSSVKDDTERVLTSSDIVTSETYRGLGMVLEKVLVRSPIATKISR